MNGKITLDELIVDLKDGLKAYERYGTSTEKITVVIAKDFIDQVERTQKALKDIYDYTVKVLTLDVITTDQYRRAKAMRDIQAIYKRYGV